MLALAKPNLFKIFNSFAKNNAILKRQTSIHLSPIHTSNRSNAIPPLIWLIAKPITKLAAIITGRGFRKWWAALPHGKRNLFWTHVKRHQHKYGIIFGGSGFFSFVYYETHIQETPITHRRRFILFNNHQLQEIEMIEKEQLYQIYEKNIVNVNSPYSLRALRVANRLFAANKEIAEIANVDWKLIVIDADVVNAVAFPVQFESSFLIRATLSS